MKCKIDWVGLAVWGVAVGMCCAFWYGVGWAIWGTLRYLGII